MAAPPVLSQRTLNRTLLRRQFLLERTPSSALAVIEHLVALQAQEPNWPYVGLWARMVDFRHEELSSLLHGRTVVRATMLRATQHLASAADYAWLRPALQPLLDRHVRAAYYTSQTEGLDLTELAATALELLGDQAMPRPTLGRMLAERYPGRKGTILAGAVGTQVGLVHPPPGCTWGSWSSRPRMPVAEAEGWTGLPMDPAPGVEELTRRYLAAFGPASIKDLQVWCGLPQRLLRPAVEGMRGQLRLYRDERGVELLDLAGAPLADAESPAPPRFLPAYDNLILSHSDRSRVIATGDRPRVIDGAVVQPTFLLDGFVRGAWALEGEILRVCPFQPLAGADAAALLAEAERLAAFLAPGGPAPKVELDRGGPGGVRAGS